MPLPPGVNFTCVPCSVSRTNPANGADEDTPQVKMERPAKRLGQIVGSSSSVKTLCPGTSGSGTTAGSAVSR